MTINLIFSFLWPYFDKMAEYYFQIKVLRPLLSLNLIVLNKIIQQYPFLILYTQER